MTLTPEAKAVLRVLACDPGPWTPTLVAGHEWTPCRVGVDAAGRILMRLTFSGHVEKVKRGHYRITDAGRAALEERP